MTDRTNRSLLAFDCAGAACSAAIWHGGGIMARRHEAMVRGHSEHLVPMIQQVMAESGIGYPELDAIAVTCGPGGFTGVRIGLATARGLALASGKPLLGFSSFAVLAAAVPEAERSGRITAVLIDAKRADLYVRAYDAAGRALGEAAALAPDALDRALPPGPLLLVGDGAEQAVAALTAAGRSLRISAAPGAADAAVLAGLAARADIAGAPPPQPVYLRAPDVTLPADSAAAGSARP